MLPMSCCQNLLNFLQTFPTIQVPQDARAALQSFERGVTALCGDQNASYASAWSQLQRTTVAKGSELPLRHVIKALPAPLDGCQSLLREPGLRQLRGSQPGTDLPTGVVHFVLLGAAIAILLVVFGRYNEGALSSDFHRCFGEFMPERFKKASAQQPTRDIQMTPLPNANQATPGNNALAQA